MTSALRSNSSTDRAVIVFHVSEDIYNSSNITLLIKKGEEEQIPISKPRNYLSYCYELCGRLNVPFQSLSFKLNDNDLESKFEQRVRSSCVINVFANNDLPIMSDSQLKSSMIRLRQNPKYSDVKLKIGETIIESHKCILASRSQKFKMMLSASMEETIAETEGEIPTVEIPLPEGTNPQLLVTMINWIYSSEIDFPDKDKEIFDLILLADEYLMEDLRRRCEDELLYRLDGDNCLEILVLSYKYGTVVSGNLVETCISTLIEDFDVVLEKGAGSKDLEGKLFSVPGLVTKMLQFIHQKKNKFKRVAFLSRDSSRDTFFSGT